MTGPVIAVVNDDTSFLNMMHDLLSHEGFETFVHKVGSTAYDKIRETKPDLVVLDIRMNNPESGWHVLDLMRLDPETSDIPVIVCSADTVQLREKQERLRQKNAKGIEKPFDLQELLEAVEHFIGPAPGRCSVTNGEQ